MVIVCVLSSFWGILFIDYVLVYIDYRGKLFWETPKKGGKKPVGTEV